MFHYLFSYLFVIESCVRKVSVICFSSFTVLLMILGQIMGYKVSPFSKSLNYAFSSKATCFNVKTQFRILKRDLLLKC